MGWELRGSRRYFYRKHWNGGQVLSEYVGPGAIGELAAMEDDRHRAERHRRRKLHQQRIRDAQAIDAELKCAANLLRAAATIILEDAGLHRHKGTWRKKRRVERTATDER